MTSRTPEYYNKTLRQLDQNYYLILNEYTDQYPRAKTYYYIPDANKSLEDDMNNLKTLQKDFF